MKSYQERLPMIDKAIDALGGKWPKDAVNGDVLHQFHSGRYIASICESTTVKVICTREEFEQRKAELAAKEQPMKYEYGVEYETNGRKPDLPDDVLVEVFNGEYWLVSWTVGNFNWDDVEKFRIVDERYKPKEQDMSDWYEKGELPPVGEVVDAMTENRTWVKSKVLDHRINSEGVNVAACMNNRTYRLFWSADFRPLRTETDKLIEQMCDDAIIGRDKDVKLNPVIVAAIERLAKAGYRKIKPMSEDEFVAFAGAKGIREAYRAGCRFIEQGE